MHVAPRYARPPRERRAYSLLELTAVVAVVGVLAGVAAMRFGHDTIAYSAAEGYASQLSLAIRLARRQAISEGLPAAVVLSRDSGAVASATIVRVGGSGDEPVDAVLSVPRHVVVTAPSDRWQFDFTGALSTPAAGGTIQVAPVVDDWEDYRWRLTVTAATGHTLVEREEI
ncbi:MAG: GspH/FimT family pseudopilin [Planctomycetota bacterium]